MIFAGDFNLFLDRSLETKGGNACLKKQSLSKLLHIKEKLSFCDIWRIRNPKAKQYTFKVTTFFWFYSKTLRLHFYLSEFLGNSHTHRNS